VCITGYCCSFRLGGGGTSDQARHEQRNVFDVGRREVDVIRIDHPSLTNKQLLWDAREHLVRKVEVSTLRFELPVEWEHAQAGEQRSVEHRHLPPTLKGTKKMKS
jgi:hypothetical protein